MNKKILAAAIAASVIAAPVASAEATIYGKMHASIDNQDYEGDKDNWEMNSRASRLGVKGSEDLGGGLKAIYQIEVGLDIDGNDGGSNGQDGGGVNINSQRNTFVGLAGGFGTFLVGRHDIPEKIAFYAAGNERLGDSIIDLNIGGTQPIGVFHEVRADNAIAYISPSFSGFTFAAAAMPGEDSGLANNDADGLADHYSLGAMYKGNGLKASVGYTDQDMANAPAVMEVKRWQAGASYTMNNFSIGAQYEDEETDNVDEYTAWAVTGKATFGNNAISLVYTDSERDVDNSAASTETQGWGIAAEHNFSKRTKVYAAYADNELDENAAAGNNDVDDDAFSLGIIHNF